MNRQTFTLRRILDMYKYILLYYIFLNKQGLIEGDQIEVAAFSLESFAYLTGLVTANHNTGSNSARSHIANRQEAWYT